SLETLGFSHGRLAALLLDLLLPLFPLTLEALLNDAVKFLLRDRLDFGLPGIVSGVVTSAVLVVPAVIVAPGVGVAAIVGEELQVHLDTLVRLHVKTSRFRAVAHIRPFIDRKSTRL